MRERGVEEEEKRKGGLKDEDQETLTLKCGKIHSFPLFF